jgi:hypothetical protein
VKTINEVRQWVDLGVGVYRRELEDEERHHEDALRQALYEAVVYALEADEDPS